MPADNTKTDRPGTVDAHAALGERITNFETDAAMQLVQAFHRELDIDALLALFLRQCEVLAGATGVRYLSPQINRELGITRKHNVRYNLQWPGTELGSLVLYFNQPAPEHALATAEDLIALMAGALKNALALAENRAANPEQTARNTQTGARKVVQALASVPRRDSLVLVALDDFEQLQNHSGSEWAQWVLDSAQQVLSDALREADGVFQIREGLLAVLLPRTHGEAAEAVAQKIAVLISTLHLSNIEGAEQLTASMGIATSNSGDDAKAVLTRAEQHLQLAQLNGPNSISRGPLRTVR